MAMVPSMLVKVGDPRLECRSGRFGQRTAPSEDPVPDGEAGGKREHGEPLDGEDHCDRHALAALHDVRPAAERTEEERRGHDPEGLARAEERYNDRIVAVAWGEGVEEPVLEPHDFGRS